MCKILFPSVCYWLTDIRVNSTGSKLPISGLIYEFMDWWILWKDRLSKYEQEIGDLWSEFQKIRETFEGPSLDGHNFYLNINLNPTAVNKDRTKSKKTPKFGVGPFAKLNCHPNTFRINCCSMYQYFFGLKYFITVFEDCSRAEFSSLFRLGTSLLNWNRL